MGVIKVNQEVTVAILLFGEKYKWLGEDRNTWEIYKKIPFLGLIDHLIYWGAVIISNSSTYNTIIPTYYSWFNLIIFVSNMQSFLFPLNWDLVKITSMRFETGFQAYSILGFYIPMMIIFNDWRIIQCMVNIFLDLFFLLQDALTDMNKRKSNAVTQLFVLTVFSIMVWYLGVYMNWFKLDYDQLNKKFNLLSTINLTLAAYALGKLQNI